MIYQKLEDRLARDISSAGKLGSDFFHCIERISFESLVKVYQQELVTAMRAKNKVSTLQIVDSTRLSKIYKLLGIVFPKQKGDRRHSTPVRLTEALSVFLYLEASISQNRWLSSEDFDCQLDMLMIEPVVYQAILQWREKDLDERLFGILRTVATSDDKDSVLALEKGISWLKQQPIPSAAVYFDFVEDLLLVESWLLGCSILLSEKDELKKVLKKLYRKLKKGGLERNINSKLALGWKGVSIGKNPINGKKALSLFRKQIEALGVEIPVFVSGRTLQECLLCVDNLLVRENIDDVRVATSSCLGGDINQKYVYAEILELVRLCQKRVLSAKNIRACSPAIFHTSQHEEGIAVDQASLDIMRELLVKLVLQGKVGCSFEGEKLKVNLSQLCDIASSYKKKHLGSVLDAFSVIVNSERSYHHRLNDETEVLEEAARLFEFTTDASEDYWVEVGVALIVGWVAASKIAKSHSRVTLVENSGALRVRKLVGR